MIKNNTRMLENTWSIFCGESACYGSNTGGGRQCESLFFLMATSSSCPNHGMSTCFDLFILVILLCDSIRLRTKKTQHSSSSAGKSPSVLQVASATMNGVLGLVHLCLAVLILEKNIKATGSLIPFHLWMPFLFHGFTLLLVGVRLSLPMTGRGTWFLVLVFFIFSTIDCISAIFTIIIKNESSFEASLDIFSFIGALLLIVCAFKHYNHLNGDHIMEENSQYTVIPDKEFGDGVTPFKNSGFLGQILFWWLTPLMDKGMEKSLEDVDIPKLCVEDRAEICFLQFMEKMSTQKTGKQVTQASVLDSIISCYRNDILISGFFALLKVLCLSAGPLLLHAFIKVADGRADFKYEGFLLAISLFFSKGIESLSQRQWYFRSRVIGLKVRSLLTAVIYRKQLRLSNSARITHSSGEIMNYVTVDAYRIGEFPFWFHQTWTTVLQLCIALVVLFQAVRAATFAAMVVIIVTVLCNMPLAKLQHKFQSGLMVAQDERLKACSEALLNMKVLKLYAWESHFKRMIEKLREVECTWLSAVQVRKAYNSFLFWSSPVLVSAAAFGACYFLGIPLNAGNVFTFVATLRLLQDPIRTIPDVIGVVIQAKVSFARIVMFLEADELQSKNTCSKCGMENSSFSVVIDSADFSWEEYLLKSSLRNICLEVGRGEKIAICGEVGSGKSTLLAAILGEVPILHGNIKVSGSMAYVSQTAWIQTGTIQENILFGSLMDENKYRKTLEQCSLEKDIDLLPYGDLTEIGERGVNLSGGQKQRIQLARALYRDADIYLLDDPFSAVDAHTATNLFNDYVMGALSSKTVLLVTHQVDFLHFFHSVVLMVDGEVLKAAPYEELLGSRQEFRNLVNSHLETAGSERLVEISSKGWREGSPTAEIKAARIDKKPELPPEEQLIKQEEREAGDTGLKPYLLYLRQNRGLLYFSLAAASHLIFLSGQIVQNSWMAANVGNPEVSMPRLILVYLLIGCVSTLFLLSRSFLTVVLGMTASKALFSGLLGTLFRAPMSFYHSTPLGRILSRISSDLSIVDLDLPFSFVFSVGSTMNTYSNLGVLAVISWQVLCVSVPMVFLAIRLQKCYFATAKDLMRINGTTKSMLANHLAESVAGSVSIRAFRDEERFSQKNFDLVDANASPFFHNFAATEWLIQRLEILSAAVLSSSAFCMAFLPPGSFAPGFIGMALSYGLSLNISLVMSIQNQCTLANYIISVERIDQHMHIPSEAPEVIEDARPPLGWPSIGEVVIQNLQIRYRAEGPLVVCGISCRFEGGERIGIVGRTGSGKTTLISALFRLVEPCGGSITIDGVDISKIGLHDLRSRLGIIPQDPTLFNGTVRYNLDPLFQHTDHDIWEVLERCQLGDAVEEKGCGLEYVVAEEGSNWSMGQRQLFCLGRALLKRSRVLVLDEATASVDNATDLILQKAIRSYFSTCTVITVAHRIPTVMDSTHVLSLRDGVLVEYDEPMKLMNDQGSLFGQLVNEYWSHSHALHSL